MVSKLLCYDRSFDTVLLAITRAALSHELKPVMQRRIKVHFDLPKDIHFMCFHHVLNQRLLVVSDMKRLGIVMIDRTAAVGWNQESCPTLSRKTKYHERM